MNALRQAFPGQSGNEPVFIFMRRFWVAFLPSLLGVVVMLGVGIGLFIFTIVEHRGAAASADIYNWLVTASGIFTSFALVFTAVTWFDFYFDIHIVTDRRIIDINQNRLFSRNISELTLEDVEDVSLEYVGILATVFNYGQITIQTAGTRNNFTFHNIAHPREVAAIIVDLSEQAKSGVGQDQRYPATPAIKGVINNQMLKSRQELIREGALRPNEKPGND